MRLRGSYRLIAISTAGALLSAGAFALTLAQATQEDRPTVAIMHALLIAVPIAAGVYAWRREPGNRFAAILIASGFFWAPTALAVANNSELYSVGRIWGWLTEVSLVFLVLAFPSGYLTTRVERGLVAAGCAVVALLYLPTVFVVDQFPEPNPLSACAHHCPQNAFQIGNSTPGFVDSVVIPAGGITAVLIFLGAAAVLASRITASTGLMRRGLVPVLAFAIVRMVAAGAFITMRRFDRWSTATEVVGYVATFAIPLLVLGFLLGLFRWRLSVGHALRRLSKQFAGPLTAARLRDLLATALDDPSVEIAYWSERPGHWVDGAGEPVVLPRDDSRRAVTQLTTAGRPVAAIVHNPTHVSEAAVREIVGTFAMMALQNQRLDAELRASLAELHESRSRIVAAVDRERIRIERDLHDGAQQRLVALRVGLELTAHQVGADPDAAAAKLRKLAANVEDALDEVRSLARGVYPPLLVDHGLADALRAAALQSSLSTQVKAAGLGRYSPEIESVVYFCCLEALQNAEKHSGASRVTITLREHEQLEFEVRDDGRGFSPEPGTGAGMANMRDRLGSVGGSMKLYTGEGKGTRVVGRVPVAADRLGPDVELLLQRATDALEDCFGIYRAVRDSSGEVVDFVVEHVNDAACRDTGRSRDMQLGRTLGDMRAGYYTSDLFYWHRDLLDATGPSRLEHVAYETTAEGRRVRKGYDIRGTALGAGRIAIVWRDITDRKRAEQELLLHSAILAAAAEGVFLVRASDATIVYANPRLEEIFGYEPGELDGFGAADLHWEETAGEGIHRVRQMLATVDELGEAVLRIHGRRKDGTPIWCEAHLSSFDHADHGRVLVAICQDRSDALSRATEIAETAEPFG
jgi:PAS domain S-box-containing protein